MASYVIMCGIDMVWYGTARYGTVRYDMRTIGVTGGVPVDDLLLLLCVCVF